MRAVYFFTSLSNASEPIRWNPKSETKNPSAAGLETEGFWYLWKVLVERRILDEVLVIIESARSPGVKKWREDYLLYVVPHINQAEVFLRPDDIIFARGGFRSWFPFLGKMNESKRWVLFYRAATNRGKWPFWDIVLEDLTGKSFVLEDRLHYRFNKPINPEVFKFRDRSGRDIDTMFHASHIHDKKGQWKCVDAAIAYKEIFGKHLHAVMPGGFYGGVKTREAYHKIHKHELPIWVPGMVSREDVNRWMNRCKLYIHLGGAGQNDRGNLESMACGCQQVIGNPQFHPPFVYENPEISEVVLNTQNPEEVAKVVHNMLARWKPSIPPKVAEYYQRQNGIEVAVRQMEVLFNLIKRYPVPDRAVAIRELM